MITPKLPQGALTILETLNKKGFEAYIVGGCVRDCLLGRTPNDWDITTSAKPHEVKECFGRTYDTGIAHGTVTVVFEEKHFEVTTYRIEGEYEDCRRPKEVYFTKSLKQDLLRRDFTMNAIAYHPLEGFVDPFSGREAIEKKIIQGVGQPQKRFQEDALRMLRGVRFSAQLGFLIEQKTYEALKQNTALIEKISVERIREELSKLFMSYKTEQIPLLWHSGLMSHISPLWNERLFENEKEIIKWIGNMEQNHVLRWSAALSFMNEKEGGKELKHLKFDTKTMRTILLLLRNKNTPIVTEEYCIRKMAYEMGKEELILFLKWKQNENPQMAKTAQMLFEKIQKRNDCITLKELKINGEDLEDIGINKGKQMGVILKKLLNIVHKNPDKNEKQYLIEKAKHYKDIQNEKSQ